MRVSALDESGKPVDWWFAYKVPKLTDIKGVGSVPSATGYEYVYYDPHVGAFGASKDVLTDGKGALDLTLDSVFKNPAATTGWILYNDEMPKDADRKDNGNLGHAKGVIAFDTATKTAFWLLHSWPKYADPDVPGMPTPMYGQTFLCISLAMSTASTIAAQMANHQQPQAYAPHMPASLAKTDPLFRLTQPLDPKPAGDSNTIDCVSAGGLKFKVIAKNREWGKDFWNDLVGPTLKEDMDVETWIRGPIPPTLDSDGVHKTFDIKFVDLRPLGAKWAWPESKDHAKWGITLQGNWVCVGDINRMISQQKRGGGTIAFQNAALWQALKKTDLLLPPRGMSVADAKKIIQRTHGGEHAAPDSPAAPKPPAARKTRAKH
ncbi:MAG TPA: deoxyribonuclease II family protein [Xanthobacteraceae bacterium]|jgi:deoxyribonuclease-2|nr:deoxyribonuclease II family protein [Xanthobacteraceae bacterium]